MTDCYAVVEEGHDVIENTIMEIINQKIYMGTEEDIRKTLVNKIYYTLLSYKEQWLRPCKPSVVNLKWPCFELRTKIPWSHYLLRLVFRQHQQEIIIFTGWFCKPEQYDDKKTTEQIEERYKKEIAKSEEISKDFLGKKIRAYKPLYQI